MGKASKRYKKADEARDRDKLYSLQEALEQDQSYVSNLARSMSLVLDEFYSNLTAVAVSAVTGQGVEDFFKAVDAGGVEYEK